MSQSYRIVSRWNAERVLYEGTGPSLCAVVEQAARKGAYLSGAYLGGAIGCHRLPVGDPRGHDAVAVWREGGWWIAAGCRWFPLDEARAHWGEGYRGDRDIGDRYLYALDWLAAQPVPEAVR